jgi:hypothetical protein
LFDGKPLPPSILWRRNEIRESAREKWECKVVRSQSAFKYAQASSEVNRKSLNSKHLLDIKGIPLFRPLWRKRRLHHGSQKGLCYSRTDSFFGAQSYPAANIKRDFQERMLRWSQAK